MNRRPKTVFVDVDDTLLRSAGRVRIPIPTAVEAVKRLAAEGATLYLWSSGGADYAREAARFLQLEHCFAAFLPSPTYTSTIWRRANGASAATSCRKTRFICATKHKRRISLFRRPPRIEAV